MFTWYPNLLTATLLTVSYVQKKIAALGADPTAAGPNPEEENFVVKD